MLVDLCSSTVTVEKAGFQKSAKKIHLDLGAAGSLDFSLSPVQVLAQVEVQEKPESSLRHFL